MSKAPTPQPFAVIDSMGVLHNDTENWTGSGVYSLGQMEAYAAAKVREALQEVIQRLEAESAIAREHKAYAAVLALMIQAELIRVSIGKQ